MDVIKFLVNVTAIIVSSYAIGYVLTWAIASAFMLQAAYGLHTTFIGLLAIIVVEGLYKTTKNNTEKDKE